jgi:hypothetical protein
MTTINDLRLNEHCTMLRALAEKLPFYMREGRTADLENIIGQIIAVGTQAGYRLNDLRYTKGPL